MSNSMPSVVDLWPSACQMEMSKAKGMLACITGSSGSIWEKGSVPCPRPEFHVMPAFFNNQSKSVNSKECACRSAAWSEMDGECCPKQAKGSICVWWTSCNPDQMPGVSCVCVIENASLGGVFFTKEKEKPLCIRSSVLQPFNQ